MLITKDFVLLNISKTGSTFVRTVLKRVHGYNPPGQILGSRKLARYWTRNSTKFASPNAYCSAYSRIAGSPTR